LSFCQGPGWEIGFTALLLISNESSCVNARTQFHDAGHIAGIVRLACKIGMARGLAARNCNAQLTSIRNFSRNQKK
jgi:hypothetical protein